MTIEIDHTSLSVSDYEAAKKFYAAALKPLRIEIVMEFPVSDTGTVDVCGLGADGKPFFWLANAGKTTPRLHICFRAETRAQVDAFHAAAMAAGATDNGKPGLRTMYHPTYYGAFVLDADGHNIEAVCHAPEGAVAPKKAPARKVLAKKPTRKNATPARKPLRAAKKASAKKPTAKTATKAPNGRHAAGLKKPPSRTGKGRR